MDALAIREKAMEYIKKYRYVALVLLVGLLLMALPEGTETKPEPIPPEPETKSLQESLEEILCQVQGAGKVRVLLTEAAGEERIYQTDEDRSESALGRETVILSGSDREETGLIRRVDPPAYLGAIVLCQGAQDAAVRLSIVEAVANATGLTTDRISVLKMK